MHARIRITYYEMKSYKSDTTRQQVYCHDFSKIFVDQHLAIFRRGESKGGSIEMIYHSSYCMVEHVRNKD